MDDGRTVLGALELRVSDHVGLLEQRSRRERPAGKHVAVNEEREVFVVAGERCQGELHRVAEPDARIATRWERHPLAPEPELAGGTCDGGARILILPVVDHDQLELVLEKPSKQRALIAEEHHRAGRERVDLEQADRQCRSAGPTEYRRDDPSSVTG